MLKSTACLPKTIWLLLFCLSLGLLFFLGATLNIRQLPLADNYEHFIFPWSPSGARVQFAFQNPSLCLTSAASLVCSHWHHPAALFFLSPRLDSIRGEIFWWEVSSRWLGCSRSLLSTFRSSKVCIYRGCVEVEASNKLVTSGLTWVERVSKFATQTFLHQEFHLIIADRKRRS